MLIRLARTYQGHIVSVLPVAESAGETWRVHGKRIGVGAISGMVVALVKSNIDENLAVQVFNGSFLLLVGKFFGYAAAPIFLGAVGGWVSDEEKVHKIFWIAISMPVILTAAAGGNGPPAALPVGKAGWNFEQLLPITPAYAADVPVSPQGSAAATNENPFVEGLKLFFNQGRDRNDYRLVVHSVKDDKEKAEAIANHLNKAFPNLPAPASVGDRKPGNEYYPIVLDGWTSYAEAKRLKDAIKNINFGFDSDDNPYISVRDR